MERRHRLPIDTCNAMHMPRPAGIESWDVRVLLPPVTGCVSGERSARFSLECERPWRLPRKAGILLIDCKYEITHPDAKAAVIRFRQALEFVSAAQKGLDEDFALPWINPLDSGDLSEKSRKRHCIGAGIPYGDRSARFAAPVRWREVIDPGSMACVTDECQPNNPLHGISLKTILEELVERHGWDGLADRFSIRCFSDNPSIASSLKFLRRTEWARQKVERFYLEDRQAIERNRKRNQRRAAMRAARTEDQG